MGKTTENRGRWEMNRRLSIVIAALLAVVVVAVLTGCGKQAATGSDSTSGETTTEKIGLIGFLSGGALLWGQDQQQAVEMWIDEVNGASGLKVGGGRVKLESVVYDDKSNTAGGLVAMQRVIFNDKAKFVFGPILSSGAVGVKDLVNSNKVLNFTPCTSDVVHQAAYPYDYVFYQAGYEKAYVAAKFLDEVHPEVKRVVFVNLSDETKTENDLVVKMVTSPTREVVKTTLYERGTTDFYPVLQQALASKPDLLLFGSIPATDAGGFCKQARQLGYKGLMGATVGALDAPTLYKLGGEGAIGFFDCGGIYDPPATYTAFVKKFMAKYGHYDPWAGMCYVMSQTLGQAIEKANSTDPTKVGAVLAGGAQFDTIIGPVSFGGKPYYGRNSQMVFQIGVETLQVESGEPVEVCNWATTVQY